MTDNTERFEFPADWRDRCLAFAQNDEGHELIDYIGSLSVSSPEGGEPWSILEIVHGILDANGCPDPGSFARMITDALAPSAPNLGAGDKAAPADYQPVSDAQTLWQRLRVSARVIQEFKPETKSLELAQFLTDIRLAVDGDMLEDEDTGTLHRFAPGQGRTLTALLASGPPTPSLRQVAPTLGVGDKAVRVFTYPHGYGQRYTVLADGTVMIDAVPQEASITLRELEMYVADGHMVEVINAPSVGGDSTDTGAADQHDDEPANRATISDPARPGQRWGWGEGQQFVNAGGGGATHVGRLVPDEKNPGSNKWVPACGAKSKTWFVVNLPPVCARCPEPASARPSGVGEVATPPAVGIYGVRFTTNFDHTKPEGETPA